MSKRNSDDLRPEYSAQSVRSGVRGKYVQRYAEGASIVVIDPDLREAFPTAKAVNDALRDYLAQRKSATR